MSWAMMSKRTAAVKLLMSNSPFGRRKLTRLKDARLQAVSSRNMYSEHGFEALIRPVNFDVPFVVGCVELHAEVATSPSLLGDLPHKVACSHRLCSRSSDTRVES